MKTCNHTCDCLSLTLDFGKHPCLLQAKDGFLPFWVTKTDNKANLCKHKDTVINLESRMNSHHTTFQNQFQPTVGSTP